MTLGSSRSVWPILVLALLAAVFRIDRMPLLEPDEGRNAEVGRELAESGRWVVPTFHGLPYLDKPILYFDSIALSFRILGRSEAAARLPSVIWAIGAVLGTFGLGRLLFARGEAWAGAAILATAPLFLGFARTVIFDMALTCWVVLAWGFAEMGRRGSRWGYPASWAATALAVLTKGPVGLLLPILGHAAMALGQSPPRRLGRFFHPLHIAVFLAVLAPWVAMMEVRHPGFLRYALIVETVERLTRPTFQRNGPIYYYLPVLVLGFLPWSLVILARIPAWARDARRRLAPSPERGLVLASLVIFAFFSLSRSKLGGYVLPAFPLLALLVARLARGAAEARGAWILTPAVALAVLGGLLAVAARNGLALAGLLHLSPALEAPLETLLLRVGVWSVVLAAALLALGTARRAAAAPVLLALYCPVVAFLGAGPLTSYAEENSSRALAAAIRGHGGADARVATVGCFPSSLDYYLARVVPVVTDTGQELTSTYVARDFRRLRDEGHEGIWSTREFASRLDRGEVEFVIAKGDEPPAAGLVYLGRFQKYGLWRTTTSHRAAGAARL
jgi:4-amino-4-deoxy-L-arabinose transferase-like glycosyltransferase